MSLDASSMLSASDIYNTCPAFYSILDQKGAGGVSGIRETQYKTNVFKMSEGQLGK